MLYARLRCNNVQIRIYSINSTKVSPRASRISFIESYPAVEVSGFESGCFVCFVKKLRPILQATPVIETNQLSIHSDRQGCWWGRNAWEWRSQGSNKGGKGTKFTGRRITTRAAEYFQLCLTYFFQYSTFASEIPQVRTWGRQTCFLPRAPSNPVTPWAFPHLYLVWERVPTPFCIRLGYINMAAISQMCQRHADSHC